MSCAPYCSSCVEFNRITDPKTSTLLPQSPCSHCFTTRLKMSFIHISVLIALIILQVFDNYFYESQSCQNMYIPLYILFLKFGNHCSPEILSLTCQPCTSNYNRNCSEVIQSSHGTSWDKNPQATSNFSLFSAAYDLSITNANLQAQSSIFKPWE